MKSRMDRYYEKDEEQALSRRDKNRNLYEKLYEDEDLYEDTGEITLNIKELNIDNSIKSELEIKTREAYRENKGLEELTSIGEKIKEIDTQKEEIEEKIYDINNYIERAKNNKTTEPKRNLKNTQYNILSNLTNADNIEQTIIKERQEIEDKKEELKELINTISHQKLKESDNLLNDLMKDDNTVVEIKQETVTTTISEEEKEKLLEETTDLDKSFFGGTTIISKEDIEPEEEEKKKNSVIIKILLFLLGIIFTTIILFIVNNYISF